MKPRTKLEQAVDHLAETLPTLTKSQRKWAFRECISHYAFRLPKGRTTCMDCGHTWMIGQSGKKQCRCPQCRATLEIKDTMARKWEDKAYFTVLTTCGGYQVLRMFMIAVVMSKQTQAHSVVHEVGQYWWNERGKKVLIGRLRTLGMYVDSFSFVQPMVLRRDCDAFQYVANSPMYPKVKLINTLIRNGLNADFHNVYPSALIPLLLTDNRAETMWKTGQYELLRYYADSRFNMDVYWPAIKICIRNHYIIEDGGLWRDMIDALRFFNRDIRNPKYVCPANLLEEHNKWLAKRRKEEKKKQEEERRKQLLEDEKHYREAKGAYLGLVIADGQISVKVIESVREMILEGEKMHHCVGTYHDKEDSLIMSATIDGKRIETVEVSLTTLKVVQSRGVCNSNTEYHDRIIALVEQHADMIRQRMSAA